LALDTIFFFTVVVVTFFVVVFLAADFTVPVVFFLTVVAVFPGEKSASALVAKTGMNKAVSRHAIATTPRRGVCNERGDNMPETLASDRDEVSAGPELCGISRELQ
jgi:hypothetical protein